jgi:ribosomal protein S27E|tara:strand:+ start:259 stop:411 length:153 start_codon:yes stop_codon:yes gene_type:complete
MENLMLKLKCKDCKNTELWSFSELEYINKHPIECTQCDNDDMDMTIKEMK